MKDRKEGRPVFTIPLINQTIALPPTDSKRFMLCRLLIPVKNLTFKHLLACASKSAFNVQSRATAMRDMNRMHDI